MGCQIAHTAPNAPPDPASFHDLEISVENIAGTPIYGLGKALGAIRITANGDAAANAEEKSAEGEFFLQSIHHGVPSGNTSILLS